MKNILIAEDSILIREGIARLLELEGFNVFEANNGEEALEVVSNNEIDIVLTDIHMPKMDGIVLIEKLNALYEDIPVIAMSSGSTYTKAVYCLEAAKFFGAMEIIQKPFKSADLISLIDRIDTAANAV